MCNKTLLKVSGHVFEKKIEHESTTPIDKKLFQILLFKFLFSVILQFSIILSARLCIKVRVFKENETLKKHSVLLFTKALRSKQIRINYKKSDITETKGIIVWKYDLDSILILSGGFLIVGFCCIARSYNLNRDLVWLCILEKKDL